VTNRLRLHRNAWDALEGLQVQLAQFPVRLKIEPELRAASQCLGELHGHVRADAAPTPAYLIDRLGQYPDMVSKGALGKLGLLQFILQHFARMNGGCMSVFDQDLSGAKKANVPWQTK